MSKIRNILIRCDSSSTIGIGHIMRDLVLAKQFPSANITFASLPLEGNLNHKILEAGYTLELLRSNKKKELVALIKKLQINLLIIDHYDIDHKVEKYIKEKTNVKIFVLDDTYEKHNCDILLNHNIGAKKKKYKNLVPESCELRCGINYTLIRNEFKQIKHNGILNKKAPTIFISIGGSDIYNISSKILQTLRKMRNLQFIIISTAANQHLPILQQYILNKPNMKLYLNSNNIAQLMKKSDFAIISPSVVANEIIHLKIPFILIKTVSNQNELYAYLKKDFLHLKKDNLTRLQNKVNVILNKYDYYVNKFKQGKYNEY